MSQVVYLIANPNDPVQQYALWDTGRIDEHGGALPILDATTWYDRLIPPARALHITDWAGPSGYTLNYRGGFNAFGDAPVLGDEGANVPGVPYEALSDTITYIDWSWNDDNSGQGYVVTVYGKIIHFGGATACPRVGNLYTTPSVKRFQMQWAPFKRSVIFDYAGGRHQDFPYVNMDNDGYFDSTRDWARDFEVTDWGDFGGAPPSGYLMIAAGGMFEWGPNPPQNAFGAPNVGAKGTQVGFAIITPTDPLRMATVQALGQYKTFTASTLPTVTAGGLGGFPAAIVEDTTRPRMAWSYSDPELDSQAAWQLVVWPQEYVDSHVMTLPFTNLGEATFWAEGTDRTTRGVTPDVDLDNGFWRFYVRAQDSSGRWSAWANRAWEQAVAAPATPTNLTATVTDLQVNLVLTTVPEPGQLGVIEYSDDGVTWQDVRGAEAIPLLDVVYAADYDVPFGVPRTYRGRTYFTEPRSSSAPSEEQTVTLEVDTFALTSTQDPALGGEVCPVGSLSWERENVAGVFDTLDGDYPTVVTQRRSRSQRRTLTLISDDRAAWDRINALAESGHTLVLREPFGEVVYCKVVGSWGRDQTMALGARGAPQAFAHEHTVQLPLVQVAKPDPVPAEDA